MCRPPWHLRMRRPPDRTARPRVPWSSTHFQGSAASSSRTRWPADSPAEAILNDLISLLEAEGDTLADAANAIKTDIIDQF